MTLAEKIDIRRNDVLSVVGAGGKTTLIFRLARELADHKILVATTTKMYFPNKNEYDYLFVDEEPEPVKNGVYFLSGAPDSNNKATPYEGLERVLHKFDYTLIEADGAKAKLLKGWAEYEPVVIAETTKTLGVLNLNLIGSPIITENIFRVYNYMKLTNTELDDVITIEQLQTVVTAGLFKSAVGEKILCVAGGNAGDGFTLNGADKCVIL